jgi:hypothetical protein
VRGTEFVLDGKPFPYTGLSFFNAIYNPAFNASSEARLRWLDKFGAYGINVLRVWAQWDNARGFVDACAECSLYRADGGLRAERVATLKALAADAERRGMVIELVLFSQESWREKIRLSEEAAERAVRALALELKPHRNVTLQVWNEFSWQTAALARVIKSVDGQRLVTSSPGYAGVLTGGAEETALMDYLTPHTSRQGAGRTWQIAPAEIGYLVKRYGKPVVDDEPARSGTASFGGPKEATLAQDHILQMWEVWKAGGYVTYHHDMFQTAGSAAVPADGIPDPEFSPYHRQVFEFLKARARYWR